MGAAFLCAHCGFPGRLEHASYIDSWLDALRRDKRLIFVAASAAQKVADYVLGESISAPAPSEARPVEVLAA
jgi:antirestriction protein ArdC